MYISFMMLGVAEFFAMLVAPQMIINFDRLYNGSYGFSTAYALMSHLLCIACFIWLCIYRIVKLDKKDIRKAVGLSITMPIIIMTLSFLFKCNYDYSLSLDENTGFHYTYDYINLTYSLLCFFPLSIIIFLTSWAILVKTEKYCIKKYNNI